MHSTRARQLGLNAHTHRRRWLQQRQLAPNQGKLAPPADFVQLSPTCQKHTRGVGPTADIYQDSVPVISQKAEL